jgi:hypothetical protein
MIDLLYLTHNRRKFTEASLRQLILSTNWSLVSRFMIYDDHSTDGTYEHLQHASQAHRDWGVTPAMPAPELCSGEYGGPVAVMNDYLSERDPQKPQLFAKIDSDTMVPPGWLDACVDVMRRHRELGLLGIEAFCVVNAAKQVRSYRSTPYIGGIGLMRAEAFVTLPRPNGRFGFTAWQENAPKVHKGWIDPALPVFLLDRLPLEPWRSLSKEYIAKGWQRQWQPYTDDQRELWSWWCD